MDEFFENVMDGREDIVSNRLTLLSKLRELFLQVADILVTTISVQLIKKYAVGFWPNVMVISSQTGLVAI